MNNISAIFKNFHNIAVISWWSVLLVEETKSLVSVIGGGNQVTGQCYWWRKSSHWSVLLVEETKSLVSVIGGGNQVTDKRNICKQIS